MNVSVVGLGKLGACSAACFAYRGFTTIGVDINPDRVEAINTGRAPFQEPRLQELLSVSGVRLRATRDYAEAIRESDVTFLIVPTPSKDDGHFSDRFLQDALRRLAVAFGEQRKAYHLFVITSTVSPGTTEENLIPLLELESGRRLGADFGMCYNPQFIALGSAVSDALSPDMVLIGESDNHAGGILERLYCGFCENKPYIARMSIVSAEIAKISLNSYVTMKISFANTLASLCEKIPGADADAITRALGADRRIGPHYLKGGLSFGGPCFPRDNRAFAASAGKYGGQAILARATDMVNDFRADELVSLILAHVKEGEIVGVLGLAYKANTPVVEESPALRLVQGLLKRGVEVVAYDPMAMENARAILQGSISYTSSAKDCVAKASVCVVASPWDEFRALDDGWITQNTTTVIDCWRLLDPGRVPGRVRYVAVGRHS